jgi:hypothetical protein
LFKIGLNFRTHFTRIPIKLHYPCGRKAHLQQYNLPSLPKKNNNPCTLPIFCGSSFCIIKIEFDENLELNYTLDEPLSFCDSLPHTTLKNKRIGVVVVVEYKQ